MDTLFILTRTSGRPQFFKRCRESVKALSWPNVVHIVHCDDPRSEKYIDCDILVKGVAHGPNMGTAPYNLYNNRLLDAVPFDGWVYFLDDDDELTGPDVFDFLNGADKKKMHICKAMRWNETIWPKSWGTQRSFQTECFVNWLPNAKLSKWWSDKGGDHYYTRRLTKSLKLSWHDVLVCKAQEGKGHGKLIDAEGVQFNLDDYPASSKVYVKVYKDGLGRQTGRPYEVVFAEGRILEKYGYGRVTYRGLEVCYRSKVKA